VINLRFISFAFDGVSLAVSVPHAEILRLLVLAVIPVRTQEGDTVLLKPVPEKPGLGKASRSIVGSDLLQGSSPPGSLPLARQSRYSFQVEYLDHRLRSPLGLSDCRTPLLTGAKLPSMKASLQSRTSVL
jgi:hypothetical protein